MDRYKLLFDLWSAENNVKTNKLQMLMATNAILVSAVSLVGHTVIWIAVAGFVFSLVWVFSIGRTVAYQNHWHQQMEDIRKGNPAEPLFQVHATKTKEPLWGRVPSKYYLIGTPVATTTAWFLVIVYSLFH